MTAPRWYAAAVLAIGPLAAAALVGRPVGLGVSVLLCALIAVAAVAVPPRDGWPGWSGCCRWPDSSRCSPPSPRSSSRRSTAATTT